MTRLFWAVATLAGVTGCLATPPPSIGDDAPPPPIDAPAGDAGDASVEPPDPDPACPHVGRDPCAPGACIDEAAGGCVAEVCATMPSCCDTAWTSACAAIASTTCTSCEHVAVVGAHQHVFATERAGNWQVKWMLDATMEATRLGYRQMVWSDLDGDGDTDLAAVGLCDAGVIRNNGVAGQVVMAPPIFLDLDGLEGCQEDQTAYQGKAIAAGDVDRDGDLDLAVGGVRGLGVFRAGDGGWTLDVLLAPDAAEPHFITYLAWLDLDGDSWLDLVVGRNDNMMLYRNDAGVLERNLEWLGPAAVDRGVSCDLDHDGIEELIVVGDGGVVTELRPAETAFALGIQIPAGARAVTCGDLDGDDLPELITVEGPYTRVRRRGAVRLPFEPVWESTATFADEAAVAIGDDDGDGDLDLLVPDPGDGPDYAGEWFHLFENTTPPGGTITLVDHPGRYLASVPGYYSYGAAWLPLPPPR